MTLLNHNFRVYRFVTMISWKCYGFYLLRIGEEGRRRRRGREKTKGKELTAEINLEESFLLILSLYYSGSKTRGK